jgi:hypothetical protein
MDGAALFAFVAAVGFGWQPMPDGSERYEYIVQIDQDLAATLADGKSIPIVGEVPEGIRPIGRVRVVVGPGDVPRERLVTRLKPAVAELAAQPAAAQPAAAQSAIQPSAAEQSIVVRGQNATSPGQYNPYAAPPYQPPVAQPLADAAAAAANAWNGGTAAAPPPTSDQLFNGVSAAAESAWNDNVAAPAAQALNNAAQGMQNQLVAPLQQGINNAANQFQQNLGAVGQNPQAAAAALGDRTKAMVNELTRSATPQPALTARDVRGAAQPIAPQATVAPPATGRAAAPSAGDATAPVSAWNQDAPPASNPLRAGVEPFAGSTAGSGASEWNNGASQFPPGPPLSPPTAGNSGVAGQPTTPPLGAQPAEINEWNGAAAPTSLPPGQPAAGMAANDPWQGVPAPTASPPLGAADGSPLAGQPVTPFGGATGGLSTGFGTTLSPPPVGAPSIDATMLSQSPDRPLDGAAAPSTGLGGVPATTASTGMSAPPATRPDIFAMNRDNPAAPQPVAAAPAKTPAAAADGASGGDNAVVTLVAWVLLFGSAFGNLYLFWSYLDVRQKYRALVRKSARAVGSRFSAA